MQVVPDEEPAARAARGGSRTQAMREPAPLARVRWMQLLQGMHPSSRYRIEDGMPCIDVQAQRIEQLFDNRDPAPFRERDLDPDLADYLLAGGEDLSSHERLSVVFWLPQDTIDHEIEHAFRAHFEDMIARMARQRRRSRRTGAVMLVLGSVLVILLLAAAQLVGSVVPGAIGTALSEGLVISSWVVLWRPVEILLYGGIPVRQERRVVERLLRAAVVVRSGVPPHQAARR